MKTLTRASRQAVLFTAALLVGCGSDPTADAGKGDEKVTTWGEEFIEKEIPADATGAGGFIDGWTLHYDKFLVSHQDVSFADSAGNIAAKMVGARFVDNTKPGRKELASFPGLEAKAWDKVEYAIRPAPADAVIAAGSPDDLAMMAKHGYSIYVEGYATKTGAGGKLVRKTFHWGFTTATRYFDCHYEADGKDTSGVVITNGSTDTTELTTHGDHFFYDRLQSSPDPAIKTSLRFEEKAAADDPPNGNGDGEITLEELDKKLIDVTKYDPSGLDAPTLGAFMTALARTVGHYRGEGECTIARIE
jgi:hypothetical protein